MIAKHGSDPTTRTDSAATTLGAVCLSVLMVALLATYGFGVLLPYFVNGLHHLPLVEVASGAHDPKDMWPNTAGWGHGVVILS